MARILVAGYYEAESGKTVLASSLTRALRMEGFDAIAFKPVGGSELFHYPWLIEESKERGIVVTYDSLKLWEASSMLEPIDVVNPIGLLLAPIDPLKIGLNQTLYQSLTMRPSQRATIGRATYCGGEEEKTSTHFLNMEALYRAPRSISTSLLDMASTLKPSTIKVKEDFILGLLEESGSEIADSCMDKLSFEHEVLVVESNSDISAPTRKSLIVDLVIVAASTTSIIVNPERYRAAIELKSIRGKPWSVKVPEVLELAGFLRAQNLPLLKKEELIPGELLASLVDHVKSLIKH